MSNKPLKRVAIVGYGGMGSWHVHKIRDGGAVELAGIYDIKEERNEVAREKGIFAYDSFEEVLADACSARSEAAVRPWPAEIHQM